MWNSGKMKSGMSHIRVVGSITTINLVFCGAQGVFAVHPLYMVFSSETA